MKRIIALTLCLVLCMGLCVNVFAANENNTKGVVFSVELDKPNLTVSDEDQTVRMTFTANKEFETCSVSYTASTDEFPVTALKGGANMPAATVNPVTILPELGSIFVVSLTAKQLSDFLSQKRQSGRLHGGGLSAKSVRDIGVLIKAALRFASAEYGAVSQEHRVCSEISKCVIAGIGCIFAAAAGGAAAHPRQDRNNWRRFY